MRSKHLIITRFVLSVCALVFVGCGRGKSEKPNFSDEKDAPRVFSRVIDYKIENYGLDAARVDIEKVVDVGASVTISSQDGQEMFNRMWEEDKQRNREAAKRLAQEPSTTC